MSKDENATYYDIGRIEVLDIIKAKLSPEGYKGFLQGNALKYLCRLSHKSSDIYRDADKASFYANELKQELK